MARISLDPKERAVLECLRSLCKVHPDDQFNAYHPDLLAAGFSDFPSNLALLRRLRTRGLVDGNGARAKWEAAFWMNDKGLRAL